MFNNRTLQVKMVRDEPKPVYGAPAKTELDAEQIGVVVKDTINHIAVTIVAINAANHALKVFHETAILLAESKIK